MLEKGLLFRDIHHFRKVLKNFIIQEGFEILRLKNEKSRVTAICDVRLFVVCSCFFKT